MKEEHEEGSSAGHQPLPGFGDEREAGAARRGPLFDGADDPGDDYEEPDRDTSFAGHLRDEEPEDDPFDTLLPEDLEDGDRALYERQSAFLRSEYAAMDRPEDAAPTEAATFTDDDGQATAPRSTDWQDGEDDWPEDEVAQAWEDEQEDEDDGDGAGRWPLGLIIVAILAVILVLAGAYGIVQQRAASEAELVELRAALAPATRPEELAASREALQGARARNAELAAELDALRRDNQALRAGTAELQAQLAALSSPHTSSTDREEEAPATRPSSAAAPEPEPPSAAAASPEPAAATVPKPARTASAAGRWFVNFGSYGQPAMARAWAARLQPGAGEVVVAEAARDGRTLYRVRVVGLPDKESAEQVASQLEEAWGLSKLWVGLE